MRDLAGRGGSVLCPDKRIVEMYVHHVRQTQAEIAEPGTTESKGAQVPVGSGTADKMK